VYFSGKQVPAQCVQSKDEIQGLKHGFYNELRARNKTRFPVEQRCVAAHLTGV
jgi:hypothetical protein